MIPNLQIKTRISLASSITTYNQSTTFTYIEFPLLRYKKQNVTETKC